MTKSWREVIKVHPAADLFPMMSEPELRELGEDIKKNGLKSPIVMCGDQLLDGRNRLDAMELVGKVVVHDNELTGVEIHHARSNMSEANIHELVVSYNIHRRHLTVEQKLNLIDKLLRATPNKSDRQIAEQTKTSPTTVGKRRKKGEKSGEVSTVDTRTDKKGVKQPAAKPVKNPALTALGEQIKKDAAAIAGQRKAEAKEIGQQQAKQPGPQLSRERLADNLIEQMAETAAQLHVGAEDLRAAFERRWPAKVPA